MQERRPRLEGKVAIVAGAGSSGPGIGNGKATSVLFAREGASVLLVDSMAERAEETLAMIVEEGARQVSSRPTLPVPTTASAWSRRRWNDTGGWMCSSTS